MTRRATMDHSPGANVAEYERGLKDGYSDNDHIKELQAKEIERLRAMIPQGSITPQHAEELKAKIALLESLVEEARGCLQEIMPLHRMVLEKYEGHPDEEFVNWRMDLGVVRRAIKIILPISSTDREVGA